MSRERTLNETISDIFKASLVGIMVVVMRVIPLEQFIAQLFGISFSEFGGGMQFFSVYQQDFMMLASATAAEESLI